MSFLDNLENNLKALESREEKDPEKIARERARQDADKAAARERAPFAEALQKGPFTSALLTHCRQIGHGRRVLVQFTWLGEVLRLDAKDKRMELTPTPEGIVAIWSQGGSELQRTSVDLEGDPEALARQWLES